MKAAVIREYGEPRVLHLEDVPEPEVGPSKVLIQVTAASINPIDTLERAGPVPFCAEIIDDPPVRAAIDKAIEKLTPAYRRAKK